MLRKDGKLITYECDACKKQIGRMSEVTLTLRSSTTREFQLFDLHINCVEQLRQILGDGRIILPNNTKSR